MLEKIYHNFDFLHFKKTTKLTASVPGRRVVVHQQVPTCVTLDGGQRHYSQHSTTHVTQCHITTQVTQRHIMWHWLVFTAVTKCNDCIQFCWKTSVH